jgi:hypothetical protein
MHIAVSSFLFPAVKFQNWKKVSATDNKNEFAKLLLSIEDFNRSRINEHEIKWQGEWYDIKEIQTFATYVELLVKHDEHESELLDFFLRLINKNKASQQSYSFSSSYILFYFEYNHLNHLFCRIFQFADMQNIPSTEYSQFVEQPPDLMS